MQQRNARSVAITTGKRWGHLPSTVLADVLQVLAEETGPGVSWSGQGRHKGGHRVTPSSVPADQEQREGRGKKDLAGAATEDRGAA